MFVILFKNVYKKILKKDGQLKNYLIIHLLNKSEMDKNKDKYLHRWYKIKRKCQWNNEYFNP